MSGGSLSNQKELDFTSSYLTSETQLRRALHAHLKLAGAKQGFRRRRSKADLSQRGSWNTTCGVFGKRKLTYFCSFTGVATGGFEASFAAESAAQAKLRLIKRRQENYLLLTKTGAPALRAKRLWMDRKTTRLPRSAAGYRHL